MKRTHLPKITSLLAGLLACAATGWLCADRAQAADIATSGVGILGYQGAVDSTPGTLLFHVGGAANINDGDLTTHVDTWSNGARGTNGVGFVGIVWPTARWESIGSLSVTMAAFLDGGWFGPNGMGPGAGGVLTSSYLAAPVVQVCTNLVNTNYATAWGLLPVNLGVAPTNGVEATGKWYTTNGTGIPVWSTVPATSDYLSTITGQTIGGGANPNPQPLTFTMTFTPPLTNVTAIRVIGPNGGTADNGFLGIFELDVEGTLVDTTGDGIPDAWRVRYFGHPTAQAGDQSQATDDPDHDGLNNLQEYQAGTDPHNADSDGDGLSDGDEVNVYMTNPFNPDTDGDGLSDGDEVNKYHTDPLNWDTDGDNLSDGQEVLVYGSSPLLASTAGNGYTDGAMVQFGCFKPYVTPLNTNCIPNDLAVFATPIIGVEDDTSGADTEIDHGGVAVSINDGDLTTHVDNFPGGYTVGASNSYVGILFTNTLGGGTGGTISGLELTMATFGDGGWFGVPEAGPGAGGSLAWQQYAGYRYLAAPKVQTTTDGGTTWTTIDSKTDYYVSASAHTIGGGTNKNPDFCTVTFIPTTPVTGINGIRIFGTAGGTPGNGGFIGVSELVIHPATDSDGDGIPDWWMVRNFGHPTGLASDLSRATDDPDHDGLTNLQEYQNGTNPLKADTDGDGLSDGDEINKYHTNPLSVDSDADGLNDYQEIITYKSDPNNAHTDGLLWTDGLLVLGGCDPTDASSTPLASRPDATCILGRYDPSSGTETPHFNAGSASSINDLDLTTHVDNWNGADHNSESYVGIVWANPVTNPVTSLVLYLATFVDGGWFGTNGIGPGAGGTLTATKYLAQPSVEATADGGATWTNVPGVTSDYLTRLNGATIGGGANPNPVLMPSATFTLNPPLTNINGVRLIGPAGGTANGADSGFIGVFELAVSSVRGRSPVQLVNVAAASGQFRFQFDSLAGTTYAVQFKNLLTDTTWQSLTNITGDGTRKQVTDSVGAKQHFYRVQSQ